MHNLKLGLYLKYYYRNKNLKILLARGPVSHSRRFWVRMNGQPDAAGGRFTMLTTTPNASVSPYHHRMPFILRAEQLGAWLGDDWLAVLENPDRAPLDKIQKQPELF